MNSRRPCRPGLTQPETAGSYCRALNFNSTPHSPIHGRPAGMPGGKGVWHVRPSFLISGRNMFDTSAPHRRTRPVMLVLRGPKVLNASFSSLPVRSLCTVDPKRSNDTQGENCCDQQYCEPDPSTGNPFSALFADCPSILHRCFLDSFFGERPGWRDGHPRPFLKYRRYSASGSSMDSFLLPVGLRVGQCGSYARSGQRR